MGQAEGYTEGWNKATMHGNRVVAERNQIIAERNQLIDRLYGANERLGAENAQLKQQLQLQQEQAQTLRAESEAMFKAFQGAVAIARPAMKAVAKLSLQERGQIFYQYGEEAVGLQSLEYVTANRFPHNQPLVQQYLPIANQVFVQTYEQLRRQEADSKAEPAT
ncbi:hypothetical protein D8B31_21485 [Verminephrobacter eiseniae]|nr:hypothetical protein [Verminephrobacter eiseniae]MCW8187098.1 hypothetical protein [Verminephrobacter eiseniae]MCW8223515.1 hypothetical protein [Verminephrobacter eiseniae]